MLPRCCGGFLHLSWWVHYRGSNWSRFNRRVSHWQWKVVKLMHANRKVSAFWVSAAFAARARFVYLSRIDQNTFESVKLALHANEKVSAFWVSTAFAAIALFVCLLQIDQNSLESNFKGKYQSNKNPSRCSADHLTSSEGNYSKCWLMFYTLITYHYVVSGDGGVFLEEKVAITLPPLQRWTSNSRSNVSIELAGTWAGQFQSLVAWENEVLPTSPEFNTRVTRLENMITIECQLLLLQGFETSNC